MMRGKTPLQWLTEETLLFRQRRQAHDQLIKKRKQIRVAMEKLWRNNTKNRGKGNRGTLKFLKKGQVLQNEEEQGCQSDIMQLAAAGASARILNQDTQMQLKAKLSQTTANPKEQKRPRGGRMIPLQKHWKSPFSLYLLHQNLFKIKTDY